MLRRSVVGSGLVLAGVVGCWGVGCSASPNDDAARSSSAAAQDEGAAANAGKKSVCVTTTEIKNTFGGVGTFPRDLNEKGQIAGSATRADGSVHAFVWSGGALVDLGTLGGRDSDASSINDQGEIVGYAAITGGTSPSRATLWKNGQTIDLGTLGGDFSIAGRINNAGQIVGNSLTASGQTHAFLWENGTMTDLGTLPGGDFSSAIRINDKGEILGHSSVPGDNVRHVFLWKNGVMTDLGAEAPAAINKGGDVLLNDSPNAYLSRASVRTAIVPYADASSTYAIDLNDAGQVIGSALRGGLSDAFLWEDGKPTQTIAAKEPKVDVSAIALNNHGQVVGLTGQQVTRAFSWKDGELTYLAPPGNSMALAVNDKGQIMGTDNGTSIMLWETRPCTGGNGGDDAGGGNSGDDAGGGGKTY